MIDKGGVAQVDWVHVPPINILRTNYICTGLMKLTERLEGRVHATLVLSTGRQYNTTRTSSLL